MSRNVGHLDRYARIAAGTTLVGAGAFAPGPVGTAAGLGVGGVALATGITGQCPAYDLVGIDTTSDDDTPSVGDGERTDPSGQ